MGLGKFFKKNLGSMAGLASMIPAVGPFVGAGLGLAGGLASGKSFGQSLKGAALSAIPGGLGALGKAVGTGSKVGNILTKAGNLTGGGGGGGLGKLFGGGEGGIGGFLNSDMGRIGLEVGGGLLAQKALGDRPDMKDYIPQRSLETEVGNVQREQFRRASAALSLGGSRAIESARASGMTGSALGSGLQDVFSQQGDTMLGLLAQESDARMGAINADIQRDTGIGMARHGDKLDAYKGKAESYAQMIGGVRDSLDARQQNNVLQSMFSKPRNEGTPKADGSVMQGTTSTGAADADMDFIKQRAMEQLLAQNS